jgi:hypothetical protein
MPKFTKADLDFPFGFNVRPKAGGKKKGGRRRLSAAQKAAAQFYMKPRRR